MNKLGVLIAVLLLCCWSNCLGQDLKGAKAEITTSPIKGKVYALVVGVSTYQNHPLVPNLKYARADAEALVDFLNTSFNIPGGLVKGELITLLDDKATAIDIYDRGINRLTSLCQRKTITSDDLILLYFSGHGGAFNSVDSYFFAHDSQHMQDAGSSVSLGVIKNSINTWRRITKAEVLLVFDACRSATVGMGEDGIKQANEVLNKRDPVFAETLFAASKGGKPAIEIDSLKHGIFTHQLLMGLYGHADNNPKNGVVTLDELKTYVEQQVKKLSKNKQAPAVLMDDDKTDKPLMACWAGSLAMADLRLNPNMQKANTLLAANTKTKNETNKGAGGNQRAIDLGKLIQNFNEAMAQKNLIKPANACAFYFYTEMKKLVPETSLDEYRTDLAIALYKAGQGVIKNDLEGRRLYILNSPIDKEKHFDLTYYADAELALKTYQLVKPNYEKMVDVLAEYCGSLQLTLEAVEKEDSLITMRAEAKIRNAIKTHPDQPLLWQALALAIPDYQTKETIQAAEKAHALAPQWSFPLVTLGDCYEQLGDTVLHMKYYRQAVSLSQYDFVAFVYLGNALSDKGLDQQAIEQYKKAIEINPSYSVAYNSLGYSLYMLDKNEEAIEQYRKAIALDPYDASTYSEICSPLFSLRKYKEIIEQSKKAIALDPKEGYYYQLMGSALHKLDRPDEAIEQLQKAIALDPYDGLAYSIICEPLLSLEKYDEVIEQSQKAIALDPKESSYYIRLGVALDRLHRHDEATVQFQKGIALDPSVARYYELMGQLLDHVEKYDEAIVQYQKAIALDPSEAGYYLDMGISLYESGKRKKAIVQYKKAIESDPTDTYNYLQLACLYAVLGNTTESLQQLSLAFEKGYTDWDQLLNSDDLKKVRKLKQFKDLLAKYKK